MSIAPSLNRIPMKNVKSCGILVFSSGLPREFLLMKHPKRWDLPKGHIEADESELDCALRELQEETGITREQIEVDLIFRFDHVYHPSYRRLGGAQVEKTLVIFLGRLKDPVEIRPNEHATFKWFPWSPPHLIQEKTVDPLLEQVASHFDREGGRP